MKKYYSLTMIACCVLMFCFVAQGPSVFAAETQIKLRYAGWHPIAHHVTRGQEFYAKLVMEKTKKVVIEVYPASQLFSDKDLVRALSTGAVDMGVMPTGLVTGQIPLLLAFDIPFIFKDRSPFSPVDRLRGESDDRSGVREERLSHRLLDGLRFFWFCDD